MANSRNNHLTCLICGSSEMEDYYYPEVHFNSKIFSYFECRSCCSAQIDPMPDESDYFKMYGINDHTYLTKLNENESVNFERSFPKYNHQKYQVDFFTKYDYSQKGKTLLDYGCGSGFYMYHAQNNGLTCTGVEFNPDFAALLKTKSGLNIVAVTEIKGKTFDFIHLGHVLEHMENPNTTLDELKKYAHKDTIFIFDGPLEKNTCLTRFIIKLISKLKNKKCNTYPPQHLTFTNYDSQILLFKRNGIIKMNYEVQEQMFPLPEHFSLRKPIRSLLFIISRVSINISKLHPKWGNIFHFSGKLSGKA